MKTKTKNILLMLILFLSTSLTFADDFKITLKDRYDHFYFYPDKHKDTLFGNFEKYYWNGIKIELENSDLEQLKKLGGKIEKKDVSGINRSLLRQYIENEIASKLDNDGTGNSLSWNGEGRVSFSNEGMMYKKLDVDLAVYLLEKAIKERIADVELPVTKKNVDIIADEKLQNIGINGIVSVGSSDFTGSNVDRVTNIKNAISKFNGVIIEPGEMFSFNGKLGYVNAANGFVKGLVIRGTALVKDYGGGVCQVSTTMYRAAMNLGLPIEIRRNHSISVSYYNPQGSDATVYVGSQDLKFKNDFDFPVVIQGFTKGTHAYFVFYGNIEKANRDITLFGPYNSSYTSTPNVVRVSSYLKYGQKKLVEKGQRGFTSVWYRFVNETKERVVSLYKPKTAVWEVGGLKI